MAEIIVDDADPRIQYSNGWYTGGQPIEYNGSTHGTEKYGVTATFAFTGLSVSVYGTVSPTNKSSTSPTSMYSVDGSAPVIFNPGTPSSTALFNQSFYQSPVLKDGQHTLVITCNATNTFFWLDYIQVNILPMVSTTTLTINWTTMSTTPTSSSTSPIVTSNEVTRTGNTMWQTKPEETSTVLDKSIANRIPSPSLPRASDLPSETSSPLVTSSPSKTPTGIIVGAVMGGLIFFVVLFLIWHRRRRRHGQINILRSLIRFFHKPLVHWNEPQRMTDTVPFNIPEAPNGSPRRVQENSFSTLPVEPGFGYITRGTISSEKYGLHKVLLPRFQSQSISSSSYSRQELGGEESPPSSEISYLPPRAI